MEAFTNYKAEDGGSAVPAAAEPAEAAAEAPAAKEAPKESAPAPAKSAPAASSEGDRVFASPAARALALEKGIDIEAVTGTGPNGRILKSDVESYKRKYNIIELTYVHLLTDIGCTPSRC